MGLLDEDLDFIQADQAELTGQGVAVWGGKRFNATFDNADESYRDGAGQLLVQDGQVLRCTTSDLPSDAARGDALKVDGTDYIARELLKLDEGRITLVQVAPA